jgi:restriction endonuclease S subunit
VSSTEHDIGVWTAPSVTDIESDDQFRLAVHKWLQRADPVFPRLAHLFQPLRKHGTPRKEMVDLSGQEVDVLTVSIHFDGSITLREVLPSSYISGKKLYRARPGDVVLSRIDVHHGATGVLPHEFAEALFTNEFIIFEPAPSLNAVFLQLLLRQPYYRLETRGQASGSTGRKRFAHDDLPKIQVPILPRPTQDQILEAYHDKLSEAHEVEKQIEQTRAKAHVKILQALKLEPISYGGPHWTFTIGPDEVTASYNCRLDVRFQAPVHRTLEESLLMLGFVRLRHGLLREPPIKKRPPGLRDTWDEEIPILKVRNLTDDEINWEDVDYVTERTFADIHPPYHLRTDDVLVSATGKGSIGKIGLMEEQRDATVDGHVMIVRPDVNRLDPEFLVHYLRTSVGQAQFERLYVGSTGQTEFNIEDMEHMLVPPVDIDQQKYTVSAVRPYVLRIRQLRRLQEEIKAEAEEVFLQELLKAAG